MADATTVYQAMRDAVGDSYALTGHADASLWARASGLAAALATIQTAQDQALPSRITDLLPGVEPEYGLVPSPGATLADRRAALAARMLPPLGASRPVLESQLRALLGTGFVSYVTHDNVARPVDPSAGPGLFLSPFAKRKLLRLTRDLVPLPGPAVLPLQAVPIEPGGAVLVAGDVVVIDPDAGSLAERLTVTTVGPSTLAVAPTRGHEHGAIVTTQPWPYWIGTRRHVVVFVTDAVVADAPALQRIHALLAVVLRAPTKWSVVSRTGMRLGIDPLGTSTLE